MKIGTVTAGVGTVTSFNLQYIPQYLYFNNATTPQAIQVKIGGSGLVMDLDTKGIDNFGSLRLPGLITNGVFLPLANGYIASPDKVITIDFTNNVAAAIDLYGFSLQRGTTFVQSLRQQVLAGSGARIQKFACLGLPNIAATDIINIEYQDGWIQQSSDVEVKAIQSLYQNDVNASNSGWVDNFAQNVKSVSFTPTATQTIYIMRFLSPGQLTQNVNVG